MKTLLALTLCLLLVSCEKITKWESPERSFRYADFNLKYTVEYTHSDLNNRTTISVLSVKFTPTRVGAYLIGGSEKVISKADEAKDYEFKWGSTTGTLTVIFSDGRSIEVTKVPIE